jgi:uncharacterized PurR-regulated membrane protein YhhQ (DUF165 family)
MERLCRYVAASLGYIALAAYVAAVIAANLTTAHHKPIHVGIGFIAAAGTPFAASTFLVRDLIQERLGRWAVIAAIIIGAIASMPGSPLRLALASGFTFLLSETADWYVYDRVRKHSRLQGVLWSNIVGGFLDTTVFLVAAGMLTWDMFAGQLIVKLLWAPLVVVVGFLAFLAARSVFRRFRPAVAVTE